MTTNKYPCYFEGQESYILPPENGEEPKNRSGYEKLYSDIAANVLMSKYSISIHGASAWMNKHNEIVEYYSTIRRNGDEIEDEYLIKSRIDFCINNFLSDDQAAAITLLYGLYQDNYATRIGFNSLDNFIKSPIVGYWYNKQNNYPASSTRNIKKDSIAILSKYINDIRYGPRYRDMKDIENDIYVETFDMFYDFKLFKHTSDYLKDYKSIYLEDTTLDKKEVTVLYRAGINNVGKLIEVAKSDGLECVKKTRGYDKIKFSKLKSYANRAIELDNYLNSIDKGLMEANNVHKESEKSA